MSIPKCISLAINTQQKQRLVEAINGDQKLMQAIETIVEMLNSDEEVGICIPVSHFYKKNLGVLEVAVKYLKESEQMQFSKIAQLLKRDERTVWATYQKASVKCKKKLNGNGHGLSVPLSIFTERSYGPLEALTVYLRDDAKMSFNEIARTLNRNYRTVWLTYKNAKNKRG